VLLKNQDNFSRWAKMDPNMKKTYTGTDGTVGFISAWDSKSDSVGTGEQEIKKITPNERVDFELRFKKPFEATNNAYLALADANNGTATEITWGFDGKMSYPMNLMLIGGNMDKMIGDDFQTGLNNLKQILEK
ncbi:MAG: polyketide cyclase, partial [Chitinophagia bacterium]|nr:polyketide cyclase [Chitinophagia bacterium]